MTFERCHRRTEGTIIFLVYPVANTVRANFKQVIVFNKLAHQDMMMPCYHVAVVELKEHNRNTIFMSRAMGLLLTKHKAKIHGAKLTVLLVHTLVINSQ